MISIHNIGRNWNQYTELCPRSTPGRTDVKRHRILVLSRFYVHYIHTRGHILRNSKSEIRYPLEIVDIVIMEANGAIGIGAYRRLRLRLIAVHSNVLLHRCCHSNTFPQVLRTCLANIAYVPVSAAA
jgi:hypothetical protein